MTNMDSDRVILEAGVIHHGAVANKNAPRFGARAIWHIENNEITGKILAFSHGELRRFWITLPIDA